MNGGMRTWENGDMGEWEGCAWLTVGATSIVSRSNKSTNISFFCVNWRLKHDVMMMLSL